MSKKVVSVSPEVAPKCLCINFLLRGGGWSIVHPSPRRVGNARPLPNQDHMSPRQRGALIRRITKMMTCDEGLSPVQTEEVRDALMDMHTGDLLSMAKLLQEELSTRVEVEEAVGVHHHPTPRMSELSPEEFAHTRRRI